MNVIDLTQDIISIENYETLYVNDKYEVTLTQRVINLYQKN